MEEGNEAMDIIDENSDPFAIKQLVNLDLYLKQKVDKLPAPEQPKKCKRSTMRLNSTFSNKYMEYTFTSRELFFITRSNM